MILRSIPPHPHPHTYTDTHTDYMSVTEVCHILQPDCLAARGSWCLSLYIFLSFLSNPAHPSSPGYTFLHTERSSGQSGCEMSLLPPAGKNRGYVVTRDGTQKTVVSAVDVCRHSKCKHSRIAMIFLHTVSRRDRECEQGCLCVCMCLCVYVSVCVCTPAHSSNMDVQVLVGNNLSRERKRKD